jgi:hypothetical protein
MKMPGGTVAALIAFVLGTAAGYVMVTYTDWLGKDWRVALIVGLLGYLAVRIVTGAVNTMRR